MRSHERRRLLQAYLDVIKSPNATREGRTIACRRIAELMKLSGSLQFVQQKPA